MKPRSLSRYHLHTALCRRLGGWFLFTITTAVVGWGQVTKSGDYISPPYEHIGFSGTGSLRIANGATWFDQIAIIGYAAGSRGTVTVDGVGSKWTNTEGLVVGREGNGTLSIVNGGTVVTNLFSYIGNGLTGRGTVVVTGNGSTWTTKSLTLADTGTGILTVSNGGAVFTDDIRIADTVSSTGTITVTGAGSTLTNVNGLSIGSHGGTAVMNISNGGSIFTFGGTDIGYGAGSTGTLTVAGAGSTFTSGNGFDGLYLGYDGATGSLAITNGGTVVTNGSSGISNGTVKVEGPGSSWTVSGSGQTGQGDPLPAIITVGEDSGSTSAVAISNGGSVTSGTMGIGLFGGTGAVTVDGAGSTLTTKESFLVTKDGQVDNLSLFIGLGGTGSLTLSNGGTANVVNGAGNVDLGINNLSFGQTSVSGVGAGTLNIGGTINGPAASGGILNAASVSTGAGTGLLQFNTTAAANTPYYFTTTGTAAGNGIAITGGTQVINTAGFNVLTGTNTYSGGTNITGGTLAIGNGGSLKSDTQITNSSAFIVVAGGSVTGNGTFTQTGAGASTILQGGSLQSSGVNVNDGVFGGMGTVTGNVSVTGGFVQVGASPDTLEIRGNYTQTGGTLVFEIDPDGAGGFLNSTLLFDPNNLISITNTAITFNFLNGADPTTYFNGGFFNLNTFFTLSNGDSFGSAYDLAGLFQGNAFSLNLFGYSISDFNTSTGAIGLIETGKPVPEIPETLGLMLLGLGAVACARLIAQQPKRRVELHREF